jgi:hypothetical protein
MKPVKRGPYGDTFTPHLNGNDSSTWLPFCVYVEKEHSATCILIGDERDGAEGGLWRPVLADDLEELERTNSEEWRDAAGQKRSDGFRWARFVCACAPRYCDATVLVRVADISAFIQQVAAK